MAKPKQAHFSHVYLYAKNWYKKSNTMEDLKTIITKTTLVGGVSDADIMDIIGSLAFKHIQKSGNPEYNFLNLIKKMNPNDIFNKMFKKEYDFQNDFLTGCLSIIGLCNKDQIDGRLAEPCESILELSK